MNKKIRRMVVMMMLVLVVILSSMLVFAEDERPDDFIRLVFIDAPQIVELQLCA